MLDRRALVLVIEDDFMSRKLIAVHLHEKGFNVMLAEDGDQALEIIKYCTPDCILLDILLPKMHGHKFLSQLRQKIKSLPVIIISAVDKHPDLVSTFENLGIEGWFSKPVNPDEISKRIREVVDLNSKKAEVTSEEIDHTNEKHKED